MSPSLVSMKEGIPGAGGKGVNMNVAPTPLGTHDKPPEKHADFHVLPIFAGLHTGTPGMYEEGKIRRAKRGVHNFMFKSPLCSASFAVQN